LVVVCAIGIFSACSPESPEGGPIDFEFASAFKSFELETLEGENRTLSDFLSKATLVSFFFPTCGACNEEMPHLQKYYDRYRDQGFAMVAVNVIPSQDPLVEQWLQNGGFTFPVLVGADTDTLIEDYNLRTTPLSFLLDTNGNILSRFEGYQVGSGYKMETRIRRSLGLN
jgi:thiol-disulfide isomerase/thioredoxin